MKEVDVYIWRNNIYNIKGMSLIGTISYGSEMQVFKDLEKLKDSYKINIAIIELNHLIRNSIYCVFPDACIIISPFEVIKLINKHLQYDDYSQGEIAAGLDKGSGELYKFNDRAEAISYYRSWQAQIPIGINSFYNIIRTIDYFEEEIFNYFQYKHIFSKFIFGVGKD